MTMNPNDKRSLLSEVKFLYQASLYCIDDKRASAIEKLIDSTLKLIHDNEDICARYYEWKFSSNFDSSNYLATMRIHADNGCADAQYDLAFELFEDESTRPEAGLYYQKAAKQNHIGAIWCHGMNLISGECGYQDERAGLQFIEQAAAEKMGRAIKFIADAYYFGLHGYEKNTTKAASWMKKLEDPDTLFFD